MTERLAVAVNADGPRTLDAPERFAVESQSESRSEGAGGFEVALTNHGDPTHVHLALDGDLAAAASLADTHPFLEREATETVRVDASGTTPASGRLRIATGHGATTREVEVELHEPQPVRVDDSLASPGGTDRGADAGRSLAAPAGAALCVLAVAATAGALAGGAALAVAATVVAAVGIVAAYAGYRYAA